MRRMLGRSNVEISAVGMGCWAIGGPLWDGETPHGWGEVDDEESVRAIRTALELGVSFFDTANVYGAGHSERVLGRALSGRRSEVVIATKFNATFDEGTRQITGGQEDVGAFENPVGLPWQVTLQELTHLRFGQGTHELIDHLTVLEEQYRR